MRDKLNRDSFVFGIVLGLALTIISALLLLAGLYVFSMTYKDNPKIFLFSFVAPILLMRWYFKIENVKSARGVLIIIFVGLLSLIAYLYVLGLFNITKL